MWILWSIWSDCHERKANLENKKVGQGKFKPNRNRKPIWKQSHQKEKKQFDISKVKCSNCNQYGHFARDCRNKKDQAMKKRKLLIQMIATWIYCVQMKKNVQWLLKTAQVL